MAAPGFAAGAERVSAAAGAEQVSAGAEQVSAAAGAEEAEMAVELRFGLEVVSV